ncbi:hypothetical protein ACOME3_009643 [Neoechinorhynchus agilis]
MNHQNSDEEWDEDKLNQGLESFHRKMSKQRHFATAGLDSTNERTFRPGNMAGRSQSVGRKPAFLNLSAMVKEWDKDESTKITVSPCLQDKITSIDVSKSKRGIYLEMIGTDFGHLDKSGRIKQAKNLFDGRDFLSPIYPVGKLGKRKRSHSQSTPVNHTLKLPCVEEESFPFAQLKARWEALASDANGLLRYMPHLPTNHGTIMKVSGDGHPNNVSDRSDPNGNKGYCSSTLNSNNCEFEQSEPVSDIEGHCTGSSSLDNMILEISEAFADIDNSMISECVQTSSCIIEQSSQRTTQSCSHLNESVSGVHSQPNSLQAVDRIRRSLSVDEATKMINGLNEKIKNIKYQAICCEGHIRQAAAALRNFLERSKTHKIDYDQWIDCSRTLLSETHKRQAFLEEAGRLTTKLNRRTLQEESPKANISINSIIIPLEPDYIKRLMDGTEKRVFYFIAFVHCMGYAYHTCVSSTADIVLCCQSVPNKPMIILGTHMNFENVESDFELRIYIYCLERTYTGSDIRALFKTSAKLSSALNFTSPLNAIKRAVGNKGTLVLSFKMKAIHL